MGITPTGAGYVKEIDADTHKDSPVSTGGELMPVQPYLFCVLECDRPVSGGARYCLRGVEEVVIGRGGERGSERKSDGGIRRLQIRVPGRSMSSLHARLRMEDGDWVFEDAGSTNGSLVNGAPRARTALRDGDTLEMGHTLFVFRAAIPTPSGTPLDVDSSELGNEAFATLLPDERARLHDLERMTRSDLSVLLLGETGTGKEVMARAIHRLSGRQGRFFAVNCGALPAALVESHLFGHGRGAFSGAVRDEIGAIRSAEDGTILLDEVGDLPLAAQPALLRVLREREVTPVGSSSTQRVDVRFIAATHQPLSALVAAGRFRADLLARLSGFTHTLLPLRARREDLGVIVASLFDKARVDVDRLSILPAAGRRLLAADWPWNVRQLEQVLLRGVTLAQGDALGLKHLHGLESGGEPRGQEDRRIKSGPQRASRSHGETDEAIRKELLAQLVRHAGNVSEVAKAFGKARMQIQRWMKRFDIDPRAFRPSEMPDE